MTQIEVTFDEDILRKVLLSDRGAEVLLEKVMNEILQAEMTEHLGAEPGEQTEGRQGYRNGTYERGGRVRLSDHQNRTAEAGGAARSRRNLPD